MDAEAAFAKCRPGGLEPPTQGLRVSLSPHRFGLRGGYSGRIGDLTFPFGPSLPEVVSHLLDRSRGRGSPTRIPNTTGGGESVSLEMAEQIDSVKVG